jgi:hypothetical protein
MDRHGYEEGTLRFGQTRSGRFVIHLPHSCDEWEIGDADNLRLLIADAQRMLAEFEARLAAARLR